MRISDGVSKSLYFLFGAIVGSASTFVFVKKYYQKKADEEISKVEKAFTEKINELEDEKSEALDVARDAIINSNEYNKNDPGGNEFLRNRSTLEGFVKTATKDRTDYTKYFGSDDMDLEKNSPEAIKLDGVPSEDDFDHEIISSKASKKGRGRVYEISYDEYSRNPGWDFKEVFYYMGDGVIVDEEEQFIDNPEYLFGDVELSEAFDGDRKSAIYVRNEYISTDFEITRVEGSYA